MISPEAAYWCIVLWFAAFGAAVGSFLNVVVYRLPLGLSLMRPPSHCPNCKQAIRWYDNVPVFGWIKLGGRCRNCKSWISVRYPLVEAITAAMFGVLAAVEYLSDGANLPLRGLSAVVGTPPLALYLFHLSLLCPLLCAALIEYDGQRPPLRLYGLALVVGLVMPVIWPALRPWGFSWPWTAEPNLPVWATGIADGLAGLAAGALLAAIVWVIGKQIGRLTTCPSGTTGFGLGLVCVGAFLGWQAAVALALATAIVKLTVLPAERFWMRFRLPASATLLVLVMIWIVFWARLVSA